MTATGVVANYAKYLAALATAVPAFQLGLWASAEMMRAAPDSTLPGTGLTFQLILALALVPGTLQFALALKLGAGAARGLVLWFALWAAGWALLALLSAFFASAPEDGGPVLLAAAMAIVGAFVARMFAPRRVPWGRVLVLSAALWLVLGGVFALIRQGHLTPEGVPMVMALTLATLCFLPLARMVRAP